MLKFDIGVTCSNGNKKKMQFPDEKLFLAEVDKIRVDEHTARPVLATILNKADYMKAQSGPLRLDLNETNLDIQNLLNENNPKHTFQNSTFDKRFRNDEFKSLLDCNSSVYVWPFSTYLADENNGQIESYTKNRRNYAKLKTSQLTKEAANLIKINMHNINEIFHIALNKLNKALEYTNNDTNALTVRGALHIHKKDYVSAIKDLEKCYNNSLDAKLYLISAYSDFYRLESTASNLEESKKILQKLKTIDPENEILLSQKEIEARKQKEKQLAELEKTKKHKEMKADQLRNNTAEQALRAKKREALYKSILDTTSSFDTIPEKRIKRETDKVMSENLDKRISKRNLGDILAAINHFDGNIKKESKG